MRLLILFIFLFSFQLFAREAGQIEITTDEGIEVFQKEKYYLLKKNVIILSDDFKLTADQVRVYFAKDLYDVVKMNAKGNVNLFSNRNIEASGENLEFDIKNEDLFISGKKCYLDYNKLKMISDDTIKVNNSTGQFQIKGSNSQLINENTKITGKLIKGKFSKLKNVNEFESLYVEDDEIANIKLNNLDMYALRVDYNKIKDTVELFEKVKILKNNEFIEGDYAKINIIDESYKVTSKKSDKVKVLLNQTNE